MLISERHQKILEILQKEKAVSTKKLMEILYVSEATLRRDLTKMEQKGLIKNIRWSNDCGINRKRILNPYSRTKASQRKRKIAGKCIELLQNNQSYFVDSSTTIGHLLYLFNNLQDVTVITNGLNNAAILMQSSSANVYITPGFVNVKTNSILGADTIEYINKFNCNAFLFSCAGISPQGITEANPEQCMVKREMLKNSKIHILLADHTKFDKTFLCRSSDFKDIDYLVTDCEPEQKYVNMLAEAGVRLIIA